MSVDFTVETFAAPDNILLRFGRITDSDQPANVMARPIVFVPGLGGSVKYAIPFLKQFVPHHGPVYSLDQRGIGLNEEVSPNPDPGFHLKDLHAFVQYLVRKGQIQAHQFPVIMGLSLGGAYSSLYLSQYDNPFKALVLLAPAFCPHPETFSTRFKLRNYSRILYKGIRAMTTLPYGVRQLSRNPNVYEDPNFQEPLTLPSFYLFLVNRMCKKAFSATSRLQLPTAVVVPERDVVCSPQR